MRRIGGLFDRLVSFGNLYTAARKAMKGSRGKKAAYRFFYALETDILRIKEELY